MTPHQFIAKWKRANLSERSAYQQHFCDLCEVLGEEKPAQADPEGAWYTFERGVRKVLGGKGWADVWKRGFFPVVRGHERTVDVWEILNHSHQYRFVPPDCQQVIWQGLPNDAFSRRRARSDNGVRP